MCSTHLGAVTTALRPSAAMPALSVRAHPSRRLIVTLLMVLAVPSLFVHPLVGLLLFVVAFVLLVGGTATSGS